MNASASPLNRDAASAPDTNDQALRVKRQVMWNRLISVVEEGAQWMLKTCHLYTTDAADEKRG